VIGGGSAVSSETTDPLSRPRRARPQHPHPSVGVIARFEFDDIARLQAQRLAGFERKGRLAFGRERHGWHGLTLRPSPYLSTIR
jgi:hypothetical protein